MAQQMKKNRLNLYVLHAPTFFEGIAAIFDLGGTLLDDYDPDRLSFEGDIAAMRSDWIVIGQDMFDAINAYPDPETSKYLTHE